MRNAALFGDDFEREEFFALGLCSLGGGGGGNSGGGGTQTTQTVQKSDPWEGQQPFLKAGYGAASSLFFPSSSIDSSTGSVSPTAGNTFGQGTYQPSFYPGSTIAPFSPETEASLQVQTARALNGSPLTGAAQNQATNTLNGAYLGADNPYLAALSKSVSDQVRPTIDSQFESAGRYGSGAHAASETSAITNALAPYMFNQYNNERDNQLKTALIAPQLANQDYVDISALGDVGQQRDALAQAQTNENIQRYDFNQNKDVNQLAAYLNLIGGNYGGTASGTTTGPMPQGPDPFLQTIGALGSLGSLGMLGYMAFSDIRVKTDVERIGTTRNGLPVYFYRYKSGGPIRIGVMAQDVEKIDPLAVYEVDGFKMVDYARIH